MRLGLVLVALVTAAMPRAAGASPTVFWASEPAEPGDVVLLYGGDLGTVGDVLVWRLPDGEPGTPPAAAVPSPTRAVRTPSLQPSDGSLKFVLPPGLPPGVFAADVGGQIRLIGRPRVDWAQLTPLAAGLGQNEVAPGATVQLIARNLARAGDDLRTVRVALRASNGRSTFLSVVAARRYSVVATLPATVAPGEYEVWVHSGRGGPAAWGGGIRLRVKAPAPWPAAVVNVRELGARGDDVTDDSQIFRTALEAAARQGGGVVYFPAGTYRLAGTFRLPPRVVVRGDGKDLTWLKWPLGAPRTVADFIPTALAGTGEYGLEDLSLMVRNARAVLRGGAPDEPGSAPTGTGLGESESRGRARDVFLRRVRVHYLPYSGRPSDHAENDPQWFFARWGIVNSTDHDLAVVIRGVDTLEVSDSEFVGVVRLLDVRNARVTGNRFSNPMGVSWIDVGGQHIVFEGNRISGASSWRPGRLPLRYLYGADNVTENVGRGEREGLTLDVNRGLGTPGARGAAAGPWVAKVQSASGRTLVVGSPDAGRSGLSGLDALIVSGRGAGQYRRVSEQRGDTLLVDHDWDVAPDGSSAVLLHRLMGHCIFTGNVGEDVSVLLQVWGALYDCTFDDNVTRRSQGMWGLSGWFVQWIGNVLDVAVSFHSGVGPAGATPEGTAEYGYLGFTMGGSLVALPPPRFPYVRGAVLRGNRLTYGHRILVMAGYGGPRRRQGFIAARDVVIDRNQISHSPVGIELDPNVEGVVVSRTALSDVAEEVRTATRDPDRVLLLDRGSGTPVAGRP